jgi:hypothetical protein
MAVPPAKGLDEVCAWLHKAALTPLAARPAMAVPPAKGLDEVCAWLHKAALTPFSHRSLN